MLLFFGVGGVAHGQVFRRSGVQAFMCSGVRVFGIDKDGPAFDFAGPERLNA
jgi:hypothetical protein